MKVITAKAYIDQSVDGKQILQTIEKAGRVCYKSEDKITPESAEKFISGIIKSWHEAVIEHANITVRFICDRWVTHEIVRHRMASYCQESTRYCNYTQDKFDNQITFIKPIFREEGSEIYKKWEKAMLQAEEAYFDLIKNGASAQEARSVLPNSLKTEIMMTANMREWRHFFKLRCDRPAHPQMREVALMLLAEFKEKIPVIFDDLEFTS